jgi:hypothetical protein
VTLLLAAATISAGCAEGPPPSGQVSVSRDGGNIVMTSSAQNRVDVSTMFIPKGTPPAIAVSTFDWPAQSVADVYVYGLAPAGAVTLETVPAGTAKIQGDGTFLAVFQHQPNTLVLAFHWRFLASDGTVIAEGDGPNN